MSESVGAELKEKLSKPIKYQWGYGGAGNPQPTGINGYDATLLIEVCQAIIRLKHGTNLVCTEPNKK